MRPEPLVSALVAVLLSSGGWAVGALTSGGAVAAIAVGFVILAGAGWPGAAVLGAFFILSSGLGRLSGAERRAGEAKGERRDAWQVAANGGFAAVGAALARYDAAMALWVVTGSLASAGADTWATAIGTRSRTPPRRLLVGRYVEPGSNGGMTVLGTIGAFAGALAISVAGASTAGVPALALWGTVIGVAGMTLDSALGATLQGRFHCTACGVDSEWSVHRCGDRTVHTGGVAWLTNDGVNAVTTAAGALGGWLAWRCCAPS